jgi:hypothetical protein
LSVYETRIRNVNFGVVLVLERLPVSVPTTFGCYNETELGTPALTGGGWELARVSFEFTYRTFGIPIDRRKVASFQGLKQENGTLRWVPIPSLDSLSN